MILLATPVDGGVNAAEHERQQEEGDVDVDIDADAHADVALHRQQPPASLVKGQEELVKVNFQSRNQEHFPHVGIFSSRNRGTSKRK